MSNLKWNEVVINAKYGGFGLSQKAIDRLTELGYDTSSKDFFDACIPRHHPLLIQVVKELGAEADGAHAKLIVDGFQGPLF